MHAGNSVDRRSSRRWWWLGAPLCGLLLGACNSTTLLEVRFDDDALGVPPSTTQELGTLFIENGAGSVVVVDTPASDVLPPDKRWARISHPAGGTPQTSMRAMMAAPAGLGDFTITTILYVPSGDAVPTIQLEPFAGGPSSYASFLHVDLLTDGSLRIDDGTETFGHFPHDQLFLLSIQLKVSESGATARVAPVGAGASGFTEVPIAAASLARQLGAVRIWMGYQFGGEFYVDDVVVVKRE
jgi:hypothetical protein